jgi:hypothetical protein
MTLGYWIRQFDLRELRLINRRRIICRILYGSLPYLRPFLLEERKHVERILLENRKLRREMFKACKIKLV